MRKIIFLFLISIFLLNKNLYAMDVTQFRVLEDLSNTSPATVRKTLKVGATEVLMGAGLVVLSPHVPSLGSKHSSQNWNNRGEVSSSYDLLSPTTLKVLGKTLVLNGARKFISAAHEEYNILRGSRLQPSERSLFLNIKNGVMDLGLASLIYVSHQ